MKFKNFFLWASTLAVAALAACTIAGTNNPGILNLGSRLPSAPTPVDWTRIVSSANPTTVDTNNAQTNGISSTNYLALLKPNTQSTWSQWACDRFGVFAPGPPDVGSNLLFQDYARMGVTSSPSNSSIPFILMRGDRSLFSLTPSVGHTGAHTFISTNGIVTDLIQLGTNVPPPSFLQGQGTLWASNVDLYWITFYKTNLIVVGH